MALLVSGTLAVQLYVGNRRPEHVLTSVDFENNSAVVIKPDGSRETMHGQVTYLVDLHQCRALEKQNARDQLDRESNRVPN